MAMPVSVLTDWEALSEEDRVKAHEYIRELLSRQKLKKESPSGFPLGLWEGGLRYMSEDFNEIPEGFEEYT